MKTKAILLVAVAWLISGNLWAQQTFASLDEVWRFALANNASQRIQQMQAEQAFQQKKAANGFLYPTIAAGFNGQDNIDISETPVPGELVGQPGETIYMKFGKKYNYSAGMNVSYNLLNWQSIYQAKLAKVNYEQKKAGQAYSEQNLKEQLGQLYYATLTANEAMGIGEHDLDVADTLLQLTQKRFDEGIADAIAVNQARISKNAIAQQLENTRQYHHECVSNMKILLGIGSGELLKLTENLSSETLAQLPQEILPNSRYTQMYQLQENYAATGQKKAGAAFLPELGFRGYLGYNQFRDDFSFSLKSENWRPNNYVAMTVSIPVFSGFANRAKYKSAKIDSQIAEQTYTDEVRKSAISDSLSNKKMISALELATLGKETFDLSGQNLKLASEKYDQGLISLDSYLKIFDDYLQAESRYLNNLSEFYSYKIIFESRK